MDPSAAASIPPAGATNDPRPSSTNSVLSKYSPLLHRAINPLTLLPPSPLTTPLLALPYSLNSPHLLRALKSETPTLLALSAGITSSLLLLTYIPHVSILFLFQGPFAFLAAGWMVVGESAAVVTFIARGWLMREHMVEGFDGVLLHRGQEKLVEQGRILYKEGGETGPEAVGGKAEKVLGGDKKDGEEREKEKTLLGRLGPVTELPENEINWRAILRYVACLPLNFIPVVGPVVFLFMRGRNRGDLIHRRYFQLKGLSVDQGRDFVRKNRRAYTAFGITATLLEMIPFASIFFSYTNTIGAAMWAADLEEAGSLNYIVPEQSKKD